MLDFTKFDQGHTSEDEARLEAWVALCDGLERNELGNTMKNEIVSLGIVSRCTDYIKVNSTVLFWKVQRGIPGRCLIPNSQLSSLGSSVLVVESPVFGVGFEKFLIS